MNDLTYVGQIVAPHGLDGKVKVLSELNLKNKIFKVGNLLYLADGQSLEIISYQNSPKFVIITFKDYPNINAITLLKGQKLYVKVSELNLESNEYLETELIKAEVIENNEKLGIVKEILKGKKYDFLKVQGEKEFLIPLIPEFVLKFAREEKRIYVQKAKDLII